MVEFTLLAFLLVFQASHTDIAIRVFVSYDEDAETAVDRAKLKRYAARRALIDVAMLSTIIVLLIRAYIAL